MTQRSSKDFQVSTELLAGQINNSSARALLTHKEKTWLEYWQNGRAEVRLWSIRHPLSCYASLNLYMEMLDRGFAWLDTGIHESLLEAAQFVKSVEKHQGFKIACLEEIAWRNEWLSNTDLEKAGKALEKNSYHHAP